MAVRKSSFVWYFVMPVPLPPILAFTTTGKRRPSAAASSWEGVTAFLRGRGVDLTFNAYLSGMQKIALPLTLFIVVASTVVFGQNKVSLEVQGDSLILLKGRELLLNKQGFPQQVWIDPAGERVALLAENVHFHFINQADGKDFRLRNGELKFGEKEEGRAKWDATTVADAVSMYVEGEASDKGVISLKVRVTALQDVDLKDIVMHIPMEKGVAKSMQGLGRNGNYAFDSIYHWKWEPGKKMAEAWIGTGKTGLGFLLSGPGEWLNEGKGGVDVGIKGKSMLVNNYSGPRHMKKGDEIDYNFKLKLNETL
ncbi:glycoside hydrolase domain-containing protein [Puia sp. P3]|uniref:glycoside hydrolase domain-containing protein n=1 Tax=Puia sp. P3 TaxID=3423952 RepID=UPI003D673B97